MPKKTLPINVKRLVIERAKGYCEYCLIPSSFSPDFFPIDHIQPESIGGSSHHSNLALCCGRCNGHKYNKTKAIAPITNRRFRLYHPRKDKWATHFQWNENETIMLGITPIGRATINMLRINRESNINMRSLLRIVGLQPPNEYPLK